MKRKERSSSSNTAEERKTKKSKKTAAVTEDEQESTKLDFSSPEKLFSSLLSPTTTEDFFSEYWEKKPLLIQRKDPEYYGSLFSKADLERLLKKEELLFAQDLNLCRYEGGEKENLNGEIDAKVTASQVSKEVKERKATIQFHQPQRFKDILWRLNGHLESVFGCLVGANVYITPPDSQGLAPHYDDVEAFILQLEGKKKWKLYKPMLELSQDYSMDLKQEEIGEPTHEIELQEGDLLYFPRGTIHQAVTPKGSGHSTHITLSTYQQNSWGNLLTSVLTDAIDKALEADVEFRRGLPLNYTSYMGLGMKDDSKSKNKQEDFNNQMKHLLTRLANHVDAHSTADKVATDFVFNRLPPYEQKEDAKKDQGESEKPPTADSEVKFRYPECVRISVGDANTIPFGVFEADQESENEDKEMSEEEKEEEEPEDESMEESEEEAKGKKKGKSKTKQEKSKQKGKKGKKKQKEESEDDEEEEDEESEEEPKQKSKKGKGKKEEKKKVKKAKEKKSKKGKKKEESEEEEEEEDDEEDESEEEKPKSKKGKSKADAQKKKSEKGKKGKKTSESDDEDDEDDKSFNISEDIEEDSDDEEESDDEDDEGPWVYVHHSLNNIRSSHMMGPQEPSVLKFAISYKDALLHLFHNRHDFIPLKSLPLEESESMYLITSLWSEGLIRIKE